MVISAVLLQIHALSFHILRAEDFVDLPIPNFPFRLKGCTVCQHRLCLSNC